MSDNQSENSGEWRAIPAVPAVSVEKSSPIVLVRGSALTAMLVLATNKHAGQYDKGGNPYILHPLKVMHYLRSNDEELNCIALGHDLVEDCGVTFGSLRGSGFSERVIAGIRALTKLPGETQKEQLEKILANDDACKVKLQDLRHNSDIRRLIDLTDKDFARMRKYQQWYTIIKKKLEGEDYQALLNQVY